MFFYLKKLFLPLNEWFHRNHIVTIVHLQNDQYRIIIQGKAGVLQSISPPKEEPNFTELPGIQIDKDSLEVMRDALEENLNNRLVKDVGELPTGETFDFPIWSFRRLIKLADLHLNFNQDQIIKNLGAVIGDLEGEVKLPTADQLNINLPEEDHSDD